MCALNTNKTKTIIVEGNIGAGKTTFLNHLLRYANAEILFEPLEKWRDLNGFNLLQKMYENVEKWSFPFQSYALLTQLQLSIYTNIMFKINLHQLHIDSSQKFVICI